MTSTADDTAVRRLGDFKDVDSADATDLVGRLDAMHALNAFRAYKQETFALLRPGPGLALADFGCGPGDDARKLADLAAPGGRVVGFDISAAMLAQARERHGATPGLSFVKVGARGMDAPSDSFDGVRADRVLIHVPDPHATLAEMIRVAKPGGRIVVSEADMPGCWIASDEHALTDAVMQHISKSCASPYFARDLRAAFKDAGLVDISLSVWPVVVLDPASVARILDLAGVVRDMCSRGLISAQEAERATADFAARGRDGRFVACLSIIVAAATKA